MAVIRHPATGLAIGDPDRIPLSASGSRPTAEQLTAAYSNMIISASGWRTVFGGSDESRAVEIDGAHTAIASLAASSFAAYLKQKTGEEHPTVILGMDSRPTGPAIADTMIRTFIAEGLVVRFLFIVCAPEIMAFARAEGSEGKAAGIEQDSAKAEAAGHQQNPQDSAKAKAAGFCYISASHNPIGHNGIKFGRVDGGVLPGDEAALLIADFKARAEAPDAALTAAAIIAQATPRAVASVYASTSQEKRLSNSAYTLFTREVVSATADLSEQDELLDILALAIRAKPLGIIADLNGSARCLALDSDILTGLGISLDLMNSQVGNIAHRIVPEGISLEPCKQRLEELHGEDSAFSLGYVPDCDGDRGNIVVWDDSIRRGRSLEAQEVFALCCVAELAHLTWTGASFEKVAVAVNDPTSSRIDRIAAAFGARTFRAEVGEANVVGLARRLRKDGWTVRILGEGAAGGNITHPSAVRDPIDTVFALVKLLSLRSIPGKPGLFEIWCRASGQEKNYRADFTLGDIIASLPTAYTTGAYESGALLKIKTADHALLKDRYQAIFEREWLRKKADLAARMGFESYAAMAYTGLEEKPVRERYGEAGRGGLKQLLLDKDGRETGFLWMRGSGTEPVFRVMAEGLTREIERELLEWQRAMIVRADSIE